MENDIQRTGHTSGEMAKIAQNRKLVNMFVCGLYRLPIYELFGWLTYMVSCPLVRSGAKLQVTGVVSSVKALHLLHATQMLMSTWKEATEDLVNMIVQDAE